MKLKFSKIRDVKTPIYSTSGSAGLDMFVPNDAQLYTIHPNQHVLIPSGIKVNIPNGFTMIAFNKGGIATKKQLVAGACVHGDTYIDTDHGFFKAAILNKQFIIDNNIKILSYNTENDMYSYENCDGFRISNKIECIKITLENNNEIIVSKNHLILNKDNEYEIVDMKFEKNNFKTKAIKSLFNVENVEYCGEHIVYNTNVENNHNFVDDNFIIHKNCVIDSDYEGEIFINLHNIGTDIQTIYPGDKIVQFILLPIYQANLQEVNIDNLYLIRSERGEGGFGSTDNIVSPKINTNFDSINNLEYNKNGFKNNLVSE